MTKFATAVFETQEAPKPEGVVVGGYSVSLMSSGMQVSNQVVPDNSAPVVFEISAPGDYTVTVVRVAESGDAISTLIESSVFTVAPEMIMVPISVSVSVSDSMGVPVGVEVVA